MSTGLLDRIDEILPVADGALIGELARASDRLEAKLVEALAGFLRTGTHDAEGWPSPVSWVKAHLPVTDAQAVGLVTRARRVNDWPVLAGSWFAGDLSAAQFETLIHVVGRDHVEVYAAHDSEVSPMLVGLSVADTRVAIRHWVARAEAVTDPHASEAREVEANLHLSRTMGDRGRLDADLDPDTTAITEAALRVFERDDRDGEFRTLSQRRADALRDLCRFGLDHHDRRGRRSRQHPHLAVVIELPDLYRAVLWGCGVRTAEDLDAFLEWRAVSAVEEALIRHAFAHGSGQARTVDGHPLTPNAVTGLFGAGTTMERLLTADGRILEHGRAIRLATDSLRDAMVIRDRGCRFPGCDSPAAWIDAHHVHQWDSGGPTDLDNLMALCAGHHGVVHRRQWSMAVRPDGTAVFTRPDGTTLASPPPAVTRPDRLPLHSVPPNPSSRAASTGSTGPPGPATQPLTVTTVDRRGRPTTGTRGPACFVTTWDDTPPDRRRAEIAVARRRAHDLVTAA